jgi:hypothetical protein
MALSFIAWLIQALIKKMKRSKTMDNIMGCYYLHVNGSIIYKPAAVFANIAPADHFEGDFVVKWWALPAVSPTGDFTNDVKWTMDWLREAYVLSPVKEKTAAEIAAICKKQGWPSMIAEAIVENKKATVVSAPASVDLESGRPVPGVAIQVEEGEPYA